MTRDDLPREACEWFRNAREALDPSPEVLERLHRRVRAAIAGGTTAGVLSVAKSGGAAGGGAATATVVLATVAGSMLTWWAIARHRDHREPARALSPSVAHVAHAVRDSSSVAPITAPQETSGVQSAAPTPPAIQVTHPPRLGEVVHLRDPSRMATSAPLSPAPSPTPVAAPDTLESELAVVRSAEDAMATHDPARALEIVRGAHVTQLAPELAAIEIDALCALGQRELARARGSAFVARWPHAALRDRVERSCAGEGVR